MGKITTKKAFPLRFLCVSQAYVAVEYMPDAPKRFKRILASLFSLQSLYICHISSIIKILRSDILYPSSRYWTGTSLQLKLMRESFQIKMRIIYLFIYLIIC